MAGFAGLFFCFYREFRGKVNCYASKRFLLWIAIENTYAWIKLRLASAHQGLRASRAAPC